MAVRTIRFRLGIPALLGAAALALTALGAAPAVADDHRGHHRDGRHVERQIGYALKLFLGSRPHYAYPHRRHVHRHGYVYRYVYRHGYAYRPHVYRPYVSRYAPRHRYFYGSRKHVWKGRRHGHHGSRHRGRRHR